ncbi:MAG: DUF971 domain-containing protein [SAR202 cluster bacterium]|nr:DUF971 domain-containing protein [SAR202 cluster bacterium]
MNTIPEPASIQLNSSSIVFKWKDGHESVFGHRFLRLRCPCAQCVEEWTGRPLLNPDKVPQDMRALDSIPVGSYAVQFLWSDTHYTGIYTFKSLRAWCPCEVCVAEAESKAS